MNDTNKYVEALKKASVKIRELASEVEKSKIDEPIAIIGMHCRFPGGANNPSEFWRLLKNGVDCAKEIPADRFDINQFYSSDEDKPGKIYTKHGCFIDQPNAFDAAFFNITPVEAKAMDPQQRLALEVCWHALENSGQNIENLQGSKTGVFVGVSSFDYSRYTFSTNRYSLINSFALNGSAHNTLAGRISYFFDFHGPNLAIDTACSSSLVALQNAVDNLKHGKCEQALVGGVNLIYVPEVYIGLCKIKAISKRGQCRAFDDDGDGFVRGEGCGVVVLKRLSDAIEAKDNILAVIRNIAVNHDGKSAGITAPNGLAQEAVIKESLFKARLTPEDIDYIETHGTGTNLGDPIEVRALAKVFTDRKEKLPIGSVKPNIGHLEAGAGIASLIKVILSIKNEEIPRNVNFETPNKHIPWDEISLQVSSNSIPWKRNGKKRIAGVSSFGFSGTNVHVILEEPPILSETLPDSSLPIQILTISAPRRKPLDELANEYYTYLNTNDEKDIGNVCYTANCGRQHFNDRLAVYGRNISDLRDGISNYLNSNATDNVLVSRRDKYFIAEKIAFMFTGQGSQYIGIGKGLYENFPVFREAFDKCDSLFEQHIGTSIKKIIYSDSDDDTILTQTINTQPVIFTIGYALAKLWESWGVKPDIVFGHSIGEYTAACLAGVFTLDDAIEVVAARGKLMQESAVNGGMAAVFSSEDKVQRIIKELGAEISIAAVNAPENITISGTAMELQTVVEELEKREIPFRRLNVSNGFHSSLMDPILNKFEQVVAGIKISDPDIVLISNLTGKQVSGKELREPNYWSRHIRESVRFADSIRSVTETGCQLFVELGGNPTLCGLGFATVPNSDIEFIPTLKRNGDDVLQVSQALSKLYALGVNIDWEQLYKPSEHRKVILPNYPFQKKIYVPDDFQLSDELDMPLTARSVDVHSNEEQSPEKPHINSLQAAHRVHDKVDRIEIISELKGFINAITGIDTADIENNRNLFYLGLDSLMIAELHKRIENRFSVKIQMSDLFGKIDNLDKLGDFLENETPSIMQPSQSETTTHVSSGSDSNILIEELSRELSSASGSIRDLVSGQLDIMRQQLELLKKSGRTIDDQSSKKSSKNASNVIDTPGSINIRMNKLVDDDLNEKQQNFIDDLINRYCLKTQKSKDFAIQNRKFSSDWINTLEFRKTLKEMKYPIVSERSQESHFYDIDGNEYLDIGMGYGVHYFGHRPEFIIKAITDQLAKGMELAPQMKMVNEATQLITEMTGVEKAAFSNTGTEAIMAVIRLVRTVTKKRKIVIFSGSFHGTFDGVLAASDGKSIFPITHGTPIGMVEELIILPYGSPDSIKKIAELKDDLAAVLVEPVQSRRPGFQPKEFLHELRKTTAEHNIVLIFDEIITGFRCLPGGAQEWFGIKADLVTYGKVLGGNMPLGVIAGKRKYMDALDGGDWNYGDDSVPAVIPTVFGGTFCKHPLTMAATLASLKYLKKHGAELQKGVNQKTERLCETLNEFFKAENVPIRIRYFSSMFRFESFGKYDLSFMPIEMDILFHLMMLKGIYTWERRICFLSTAHTDEDIDQIIETVKESINEMREGGFPFALESELQILDSNSQNTNVLPMSSAQRRLYVLSLFEGGEQSNHLTGAVHIEGDLDRDRFDHAFTELINRHESLRTGFEIKDDRLYQKINSEVNFKVDYTEIHEHEIDNYISEYVSSFDLAKAPLIRVCLIKLSSERHMMIIDMHHIIADGLSLNILVQEFVQLYEGKELQPITVQYRDFTQRELEYFKSDQFKEQENYWMERFSGEIPQLNLPTDHLRPPQQSFAGSALYKHLDKNQIKKLRNSARDSGISVFMLLFASYNILLQKLTDDQDIITGIPISGRQLGDFDKTVGMFANTLAIRTITKSDASFKEYLEDVKSELLNAYSNQNYPFEQLIEKLELDRDLSRNPLFTTMFIYENATDRIIKTANLTFTEYDIKDHTSQFDLVFEIIEEGEDIRLNIKFDTALYDETTMETWQQYYRKILDDVIDNPAIQLSDISLLSESERKFLIEEVNDTDKTYETDTILKMIDENIKLNPNSIVAVYKDKQIDYVTLDKQSGALASHLVNDLQVSHGDFIGIMMQPSIELLVSMIAVMKSGCAYVPLDPANPKTRTNFILNDAQVKVLLTNCAETDDLEFNGKTIFIGEGFDYSSKQDCALNIEIKPDDLAYLIYTSGTSGNPKGTKISHKALSNYFCWLRDDYGINKDDSSVMLSSYAFDLGYTTLWGMPALGGAIHFIDESNRKDPDYIVNYLIKNNITVLKITPSYLYTLLHASNIEQLKPVRSLRLVTLCGEEIRIPDIQRFHDINPNIKFANFYGPTEATITCIVQPIDLDYYEKHDNKQIIGKPIANVKAYILDDNDNPTPVGIIGELCIGGVCVAEGYLNRENLTKQKFIKNPFIPGHKIYMTGDIARFLPDGNIEFLGRRDNQTKIRGYRIETEEIESVLTQHPKVKLAVVCANVTVNKQNELTAYIVGDKTITIKALRSHVAKTLPDYMIPTHFIFLDKLSLTSNAKLDRKALPKPEELISVSPVENATDVEYDQTTLKLLELWKDILGVNDVGVDDNFFEIGGHSIKATLLMIRIRKGFDVDISLSDIFEYPTITEFRKRLKECSKSWLPDILPAPKTEYYDLSSAQKRLWIISQNEAGSVAYNVHAAFRFDGQINETHFREAFDILAERHETLRTTFRSIKGEPRQIIQDHNLNFLDIIDVPKDSDIEKLARDYYLKEMARPFDLENGPLLRVTIIGSSEKGKSGSIIIFNAHHLITDGWSNAIVGRELFDIYEILNTKKTLDLKPLRIQYKDYAIWHNNLLQSDKVAEHKEYWLEKLSGELPILNIPTDNPFPSKPTFQGSLYKFDIDADLTSKLNNISSANNASLFMIVVSSVKVLLHIYTYQNDIIVSTPISGRIHPDLEDQVGFYLNMLVLRDSIYGEDSLTNIIEKVKITTTEAYSHEVFPYDELVESLDVLSDPARNPLFDVIVNLINNDVFNIFQADKITPFLEETLTSRSLLEFALIEGECIECKIEYNNDVFTENTVAKIAGDLKQILQAFASEPQITVDNLRKRLEDDDQSSEHDAFMESTMGLNDDF